MHNRLRIRAQRAPKGKWIIGHGWNEANFKKKRFPKLADLDQASPDNPVVLYHQCGRLCIANSLALKLAEVTKETKAPQGGKIDKDAQTGELSGILRDNATDLIWKMVPEPSEEEIMNAVSLAFEKIVEAGITSIHWMVLSTIELRIIKKLLKNKLPLRIYIIIPISLLKNWTHSELSKDTCNTLVKVGGVEIIADGYLSAKKAALFQPYDDDPDNRGSLLCTQEKMNSLAKMVHDANLQLIIRATGDKAIDLALTAIEETSKLAPAKTSRSRIEQAALLNESLLQRMKQQNVIVSVQPRVVASEFAMWAAIRHLGSKRAKWLYPLRKMIREGIRVIGGSDCPMEPLNPLLGIKAAVTRDCFPQEKLTVDDALRIYTLNAAYSSNEEDIKGSIEEGKLADFAVLSRDLKAISPGEIEDVKVKMTIFEGRVVHPKSFSFNNC